MDRAAEWQKRDSRGLGAVRRVPLGYSTLTEQRGFTSTDQLDKKSGFRLMGEHLQGQRLSDDLHNSLRTQ